MARKKACKNPGGCQSDITQDKLTDKIRKAAQMIYEKRGRAPGRELDDWLEAEKALRGDVVQF